ncbi:uncharacterized protein KD926_000775 [Aspergillus affinis]|uniref:uncharacterized protein n=1 Tax=Aspergillus affinis TaxID=1070780 RepID=UPI0022FF0D3E|nr:uncharacterized protein KD926_000775 [Aspergillus affinis]KAI9037201.1 hypothetical protein KD926_000775 [Aspergillus affinis]
MIEFVIGGDRLVLANSGPNWNYIHGRSMQENEQPGYHHPRGGKYGSVKWVGLFIKSGVGDNNQFIAIKTTNRLLPKYLQRNKSRLNHDGVDVTDCTTITLQPNQLYGAQGKAQYTWNVNGKTRIEVRNKHFVDKGRTKASKFDYDYAIKHYSSFQAWLASALECLSVHGDSVNMEMEAITKGLTTAVVKLIDTKRDENRKKKQNEQDEKPMVNIAFILLILVLECSKLHDSVFYYLMSFISLTTYITIEYMNADC